MRGWGIRQPRWSWATVASAIVAAATVAKVILHWTGTLESIQTELRGEGVLGPALTFLVSPYGTTVLLLFMVGLLCVHRVSPKAKAFDLTATLSALSPNALGLLGNIPSTGWLSVWSFSEHGQPRRILLADEPPIFGDPHPEQRLARLLALEEELTEAGLVTDEAGERRNYCLTLTGWKVVRRLCSQEVAALEARYRRLSGVELAVLRAVANPGIDLLAAMQKGADHQEWTLIHFSDVWQYIPDDFKFRSDNMRIGVSPVGRRYLRGRTIIERDAGKPGQKA